MQCALCGKTEEPREIETGFTDPRKKLAAEDEARAQAQRLEKWEWYRVVTTRYGSTQHELVAGHVCPECASGVLQPGKFAIVSVTPTT